MPPPGPTDAHRATPDGRDPGDPAPDGPDPEGRRPGDPAPDGPDPEGRRPGDPAPDGPDPEGRRPGDPAPDGPDPEGRRPGDPAPDGPDPEGRRPGDPAPDGPDPEGRRPGEGAVAFVCAMPMELTPLVGPLGLVAPGGDGGTWRGSRGGHPVVAVVTGMGTDLARDAVAGLLDAGAPPVARVVVVGIIGALEEATALGSLVLPEVVVHGPSGRRYTPAPLGPGKPAGVMWTSDELITDPAELARLRGLGVVALDMETAAVAEVCEARGVPWSVFRAISDRANDGSVDDEIFSLSHQDGTPDTDAVERYLAEHPERLAALAELGRQAERAAGLAADAALAALAPLLGA